MQSGQIHHWRVRIDPVKADREFHFIPRIPEPSLSHVHLADVCHAIDPSKAIQQAARESRGGKDGFCSGADNHQVSGDASSNGDAVFHSAFPDTQLHQHEHHGDNDASRGHHQFDSLVSEL